ncbi:glycosyltransferase family 2 protein [Pedobacter kyungheensis]|uniref:glycosyltransferase family 2 protein n=1 Tax=Pedobacter kyungheensis TaxID=1069985 RepID=UPI00069187A7|nr:glycosyltransferase family 2 protein [Pedobacter kyungheensis]
MMLTAHINKQNIPLVSVITIVYNAESTIEQTILSVLAQTYPNIEYIIIDGGSTDGSLKIIDKYKDKITKWISEPDNGISDAFNKGIKFSSGNLIALLNADDWYEKDAVKKVVENYTNKYTVLCGNVKLYNNLNNFKIKKSSIDSIESVMNVWHPGMFCPKEIYDEIGLYNIDIKILMDYDFVIRCYLAKINFKFIDENIVNMRYGGVSNQLITKSMKEALIIKENHFGKKFKHKLEYLFFNSYYHTIIYIKKIIYG